MPKLRQPALPFAEREGESGDARPRPAEPVAAAVGETSDPLLAQVAALCREWPSRCKWLIVPRHAAGLAFADRLARETGGWANLRVVTPLDLAIRMAAPLLLERGVTPGEDGLGPALVMRLLRGLGASPGYFRGLADQPSMASALWRTIRELRLAGIGPAALPAEAFVSAAKHAELVALLRAYEQWLAAEGVADVPAVFAQASAGREFCPVSPADLRIEWPYEVWEPLVRRFLDGLPGERVVARAIAVAGAAAGAHALAYGAPVEVVTPAQATGASRLRSLRLPAEAPPHAACDESLDLFHAGGRTAEVDAVARRVLALGRPLDEVEVVCGSEDHVWLSWEKCVRLGWKATVSTGLPVLTTSPGRALDGWCDWVDAGFSGSAMRRLLLSGAVAPAAWRSAGRPTERGGREEVSAGRTGHSSMRTSTPDPCSSALSPARAARLLAEAAPSWGRETWSASLDAFAAREDERAAGTAGDEARGAWGRARARDARTLSAWVGDLLAAVPVADGTATLGATTAAARTFLEENAAVRTPADGLARAALLEMLAGFGPIASEPWRVTDVLRLVRHEAAGLRTGRDRARPGHLHISTLDDAGADRRPFVFVVGLEEGRVFPAAREDPILLDRERAAINAALGDPPRLRLSLDRQQETIDRRLARLAAAGVEAARVVLSYSCRDTREFRDSYASWVVLNAFRLMRGDPALSYRQLHEWLGEAPASPLPVSAAAAATTAEWWMAQARRARDARAAILAAHPHLQQGLVAMQARAGDDFTIYDGLVPDAARLDPSRTGRLVSVSTLERLAGCPFRFFLEHGLQVNELDEHEPDADAWLDARTRGSELHVLYASVMRRAREQGRRVSVAADLAWARDQAALALQRLRVGMSPPSEAVFAREAEELLDDVEIFVADEASKAGVEPLGFEVEFGLGGSRLEPLNDPRPLELTLAPARVLRLRGRIDRIDRLAGGNAYQVVDYKTGVFRTAEYDGTYVMGTRLQPMIYGLAAEQLLQGDHPGARVVRGAYVFPTSRGFRTIKPIDLPPAESTVRVIELVLDVAAAGTFPAAPSEGPCRYCPLSRACGEAPQERTGRKIAATPLGAFRALRQVR